MSQYKDLLEEKLAKLKEYKIMLRNIAFVKKLKIDIFYRKLKFYSCILGVLILTCFGLINSLSLYFIFGISFVVLCYGASSMIDTMQMSLMLRYDYPDLFNKNSRELIHFNNQIVISLEKISQEVLVLLDEINQDRFNNANSTFKSYYVKINSDDMIYDIMNIENSKKKIKKL